MPGRLSVIVFTPTEVGSTGALNVATNELVTGMSIEL